MSAGDREGRARCVLIAFTLIGLTDAYLPAYAKRKEFCRVTPADPRQFYRRFPALNARNRPQSSSNKYILYVSVFGLS